MSLVARWEFWSGVGDEKMEGHRVLSRAAESRSRLWSCMFTWSQLLGLLQTGNYNELAIGETPNLN